MSVDRLQARLDALRARGRKGLAPYVTAGDGGYECTLSVLRALDDAGAACVELGVPFSDPIADGPILQAAAERALGSGTELSGILALVRRLRQGEVAAGPSALPVYLFSYANPLLALGWRRAAEEAHAAGIDGWLVPDLPVEEAGEMRAAAEAVGLAPVFFVAPSTSPERLRAAAAASRGFVYAIGRYGVTGKSADLEPGIGRFLEETRRAVSIPLAVGFGLHRADQVRAVLRNADLAIVGSAMVERIHAAQRELPRERRPAAAAAASVAYLRELLPGTTLAESSQEKEA